MCGHSLHGAISQWMTGWWMSGSRRKKSMRGRNEKEERLPRETGAGGEGLLGLPLIGFRRPIQIGSQRLQGNEMLPHMGWLICDLGLQVIAPSTCINAGEKSILFQDGDS